MWLQKSLISQATHFFSYLFNIQICHDLLSWLNLGNKRIFLLTVPNYSTKLHWITYLIYKEGNVLNVTILFCKICEALIQNKLHELCPRANYSNRRLPAKLVPTFANRGCRMVSETDPHGHIFGFLDRSCYYFFQVVPQLYSHGWLDPIPDPLLRRKSGCSRNRTWDLWPLDLRGGLLCFHSNKY
jgi:hypothetical protein